MLTTSTPDDGHLRDLRDLVTPAATDNPWLTLSSKQVYGNPWITVREDRVVRPDGEPGIYGVVHYKNIAVGVLAIEEDHVYLVGQYRYPLQTYSWETPEGGCPEGEEPLRAAQRELREETGLEAARWEKPGEAHLSHSVADENVQRRWQTSKIAKPIMLIASVEGSSVR